MKNTVYTNLLTAARRVNDAAIKEPTFKTREMYAALTGLLKAVEAIDSTRQPNPPQIDYDNRETFQDPLDKHFPELDENASMKWSGYTVKRKLDFPMDKGKPNKVGYVVTKDDCNVMPGATWFVSVDQAKKGIAALILSNNIAGPHSMDQGLFFWMLLELSK